MHWKYHHSAFLNPIYSLCSIQPITSLSWDFDPSLLSAAMHWNGHSSPRGSEPKKKRRTLALRLDFGLWFSFKRKCDIEWQKKRSSLCCLALEHNTVVISRVEVGSERGQLQKVSLARFLYFRIDSLFGLSCSHSQNHGHSILVCSARTDVVLVVEKNSHIVGFLSQL